MQLTIQYSESGKREMGFSGSILHNWGSQMLTHMFSLFSMGKITGWDLSWPCTVLLWGTVNIRRVNLFVLFSRYVQTYFFSLVFCLLVVVVLIVCWNFSIGNLNFHKGSLVCEWLLRWSFPVAPGLQPRRAMDVSWVIAVSIARTEFCMPITKRIGE